MEFLTLNTVAKMPLEGFGVFQIPDPAQCEQVVYDAIKTGYRLLDTAAAYMNEEALGKGVARAIADGLTTREELFITTKVWVQDQKTEQTAYDAVKASLAKLKMDYVDLVLLHQPMGDYFAAYRGIEKAYKDGLTRAVGVANFYPAILANLCETVEIIPAVNQVELHPFFAQEKALETMKAYGVAPQAWGPLAEGKHGIFTDPELTEIGKKYGKPPPRWCCAGTPGGACPSSRSRSIWSGCGRTSTSGASPSPGKRWRRSRPGTWATVRSSTMTTRPLSRRCAA